MNRILLLILIAGAVFLLILFAVKPELIGNIWLWLIGLSGVIVKASQSLLSYFQKLFGGNKEQNETNSAKTDKPDASMNKVTSDKVDYFTGLTIRLLRYFDDGETTVGMLLINNRFYCYTLEDTYHEIKVAGETRIAAGTYSIKFRTELSPFTLTMRERYPEWFTYHLELLNVPGFKHIYIHNGGDNTDTKGCILVSDSITVNNENTFFSNSRETFRRLYLFVSEQLNNNVPVRIIIDDEKWMNNLN